MTIVDSFYPLQTESQGRLSANRFGAQTKSALLSRQPRDRRVEKRYPTDDPATMLQIHPPRPDPVDVRICNASRKGLRVISPEAVPQGTIVQISTGQWLGFGEVRHCGEADGSFAVGVRILQFLSCAVIQARREDDPTAPQGPGTSGAQFVCGTSGERMAATILDVADRAIELWLPKAVAEGTPAQVEVATTFSERGSVLYCTPCLDGYVVLVALMRASRRNEVRSILSEPALVAEIDDPAKPAIEATAVDFSSSGFGLIVSRPLSRGSMVLVAMEKTIVVGEVRYSVPTEDGFHRVGILIERKT